MKEDSAPSRILIIDDLFGRKHPDRRNVERANLCGQYLIEDVTGDETDKGSPQKIIKPIAQAVFFRGQRPICSIVGDIVENDLQGTLSTIRDGWIEGLTGKPRWAMILLDLCFYTGLVTKESNHRTPGIPEGRPGDDDPKHFFGLKLLNAIYEEFPDLPVVILSSQSRQEVSLEFTQRGALGFLPRSDEKSPELLKDYIWRHGLIPDDAGEVVGYSKPLLLALRAARRAAFSRRNILIRGERGTGKELLAHYIHRQSTIKRDRPYQVVNSGSLSPELYASELFGHRRGAFTGAIEDRIGAITKANGGDLFLDEIGNMPSNIQSGLLRVLDHKEIAGLGAETGQKVDVRFISATNEDIEGRAATGEFRLDLLDRLREGGSVILPPLRHRADDIPLLIEKFVRDAEKTTPGAMVRQIDPEAVEKILSYDWPGNIRELRSCIANAITDHPDVEHLVPVHLKFEDTGQLLSSVSRFPLQGKSEELPARKSLHLSQPSDYTVGSLDDLISLIKGFTMDGIESAALVGKLSEIQAAHARLIARFLKAALEATSKPTPDHPEGEIFIHPAIKLITGNKVVSASKAADIIKRLLRLSPEIEESLMKDAVLHEAYETALRLRPHGPHPKINISNNTE